MPCVPWFPDSDVRVSGRPSQRLRRSHALSAAAKSVNFRILARSSASSAESSGIHVRLQTVRSQVHLLKVSEEKNKKSERGKERPPIRAQPTQEHQTPLRGDYLPRVSILPKVSILKRNATKRDPASESRRQGGSEGEDGRTDEHVLPFPSGLCPNTACGRLLHLPW